MNLHKIFLILISLFVIAGCRSNEASNTTKSGADPAVKDEYTKSYLSSAKVVEEGFYQFESKTGGYTMLFPVHAVISKDFGNEKRENEFESIMYGYNLKGASISTRITYENKPSTSDIEEKQRLLSLSAGYDGSYEKIHAKGKTIYFAKKTSELKNSKAYVYLSFIKAVNSNQAVEFIFNTRCKKNDESCQSNVKDLENTALKVMTSVNFK
ncbi:hypothetical protein J9317_18070 [Metabacillus sp. KIGAM252]|uniref:Lipoprotein YvcA n=1 Tax=Metabacillus flavus TaxID=2823519 RepID=A0ABS5LJW4_9BACI|nr:hypothetical protein [Metabacillus flavus]MBS2970654.1 hypothetical protein [Metabacillus flavus]